MLSKTATPYLSHVYRQIPRLFSRGDWDPFSQSYGCCDRTFWAWKFTDFPGARFQESAYALAFLYSNHWAGNVMYGNAETLIRARATMSYWRGLQYPDGSFDEAYPYEHSLAATAFTSFYIGEALALLTDQLPCTEVDPLIEALSRAGDWLMANDESHGILSNHLAAAAAALTVIARHTGQASYLSRSQYFLDRIYARQSSEGWYEEYGGADPGYQSHGTFYLARVWQLTGDEQLLESLRRANAFLSHCVHPNRTLGGEYGSRNTEFYYPAGFEMLAPVCPHAQTIAVFMRNGIESQSAAGLAAVDAYNFNPLLNNYLFASANAQDDTQSTVVLPCHQEGSWDFPQAGLHTHGTRRYYAVLGLSKGGVLKIFGRDGTYASDCGYWAILDNGRAVTSQSLQLAPDVSCRDCSLEVRANFTFVKQKLMTPPLFLVFRLFCLIFCRFRKAGYMMKSLLVAILVTKVKNAPLALCRRVSFGEDFINVDDRISLKVGARLRSFGTGGKFAAIHMGSARYFQWHDLKYYQPYHVGLETCLADLNANGYVALEKQFFFPGE